MIENQILEIVPHVCNDLFQNSYNFFANIVYMILKNK